jgi:hypothetical protein
MMRPNPVVSRSSVIAMNARACVVFRAGSVVNAITLFLLPKGEFNHSDAVGNAISRLVFQSARLRELLHHPFLFLGEFFRNPDGYLYDQIALRVALLDSLTSDTKSFS